MGFRAVLSPMNTDYLDHAKYVDKLMSLGVDCYMLKETAEAIGVLAHHRVHLIEPMKQFKVGAWTIKPFEAVHDVPNVGFLIAKGDEKLMFAVDSNYIPYRFKGLSHIMLGVNHDAEILMENVAFGDIDSSRAQRVLKNHMSIQTARKFFEANDMAKVREIHLLHLSDANSNAEAFRKDIQGITGRPVYV